MSAGELISDVFGALGTVMWGPWTFFVLVGAGLLFTLWSKAIQYRALTHGVQVVRGAYDNPNDPGAINHFQALAAALSGTVGLGNIGGVALAIGIGGPGALFWMWIVGLLGMALKTVEVTLALMYRNTDDPQNPHGGAMWVIEKTLGRRGKFGRVGARALGSFFCVTLLTSTVTGGNLFQSWNVAALTEQYFQVPPVATSIVIAVVVGMVIVGGIKRIGHVAGRIVPFMVAMYILAALAVIFTNLGDIPALLALIVRSAFAPTEAGGAFVGAGAYFAFTIGLKRALFSNEAGQGTAPIAHSAARTEYAAREGVVAGLGPFIDTILICTLTALVILSTNTWNRAPEGMLSGTVSLQRAAEWRWDVDGPIQVEALPELPGGDAWMPGNTFYMLGKAVGARRDAGNRSNRVRIAGEIAIAERARPEAGLDVGDSYIAWSPVILERSRWTQTPERIEMGDAGVWRTYAGAPLTAYAFDRAFPGLGKWLITLAAWLFAISTMISWSYYGEQGTIYLFGERWVLPYKLAFIGVAAFAPFAAGTGRELGNIIDFGTGAMLWGNLPIVLALGYLAVRSLKDYFARVDAGEIRPHATGSIVDIVEDRDAPPTPNDEPSGR